MTWLLGVFAVVGGCIYGVRETYFAQLRTVDAVIAEFSEIDRVWLCANYDVTFEVDGLWFSVVDQPGVVYGIGYGVDDLHESEIRRRVREAILDRCAMQLPHNANYRLR
jgi:hypothetical protein